MFWCCVYWSLCLAITHISLPLCWSLCLHVNLSKCHLAIVLPGSKRTADKRDKVLSECVFIHWRVNEVSSGWCKQAGVTLTLCHGLSWQTLTLSRIGSLRTQSIVEVKVPSMFLIYHLEKFYLFVQWYKTCLRTCSRLIKTDFVHGVICIYCILKT